LNSRTGFENSPVSGSGNSGIDADVGLFNQEGEMKMAAKKKAKKKVTKKKATKKKAKKK
jgi:hypothetical protein